MPATLATARASDPVRSADVARPPSDRVGLPFRQVMRDALIRFYGSVKATAFALGQVDPSLMQREFERGLFERFDQYATPAAKAYVAAALTEAYGPLHDPKARAKQLIRAMREELDELDQFVEVA